MRGVERKDIDKKERDRKRERETEIERERCVSHVAEISPIRRSDRIGVACPTSVDWP